MIFKPTGTSEALIKAVSPYIKKGRLLDLGCGSGIVSKSLFKKGLIIFASDVSEEACNSFDVPLVQIRCGSLFEPWTDSQPDFGGIAYEQFDYIVDDVSGISSILAEVSPWFQDVPCDSGKDGARLVCDVIKQSPKHLNEGGKLFFPIVSLSDGEKIKRVAGERFKHVELLSHTEFPLPKEMYEHIDLLTDLRSESLINFKINFGMIIFWTDIYVAHS